MQRAAQQGSVEEPAPLQRRRQLRLPAGPGPQADRRCGPVLGLQRADPFQDLDRIPRQRLQQALAGEQRAVERALAQYLRAQIRLHSME